MGEPSNPAASTAVKTSEKQEKHKKGISGVVEGVKRVFSRKGKSKEGKSKLEDVTKTVPVPQVPKDSATKPEAGKAEPSVPKPSASRASKRPPGPPPPLLSPAERAQALFKKHGLEISPSQLQLSTKIPQTERVHKEIRMRVHRNCHRCNTSFGADKTCLTCGHRRCKQCPRFPAKKESKDKGGEKREVKPIRRRKGELGAGLTMPNRRGGQDLVRKQIRQRVHRNCHRCHTDFGAEKTCPKCKHHLCKKCPRDPHKKHKPPGYYSDRDSSDSECLPPRRVYKRPRRRVHWICTKCQTTFTAGIKICSGCGSQRDETGRREPPVKKGKNPNTALPEADFMEQLEKQMKQTSIA